MGSPQPQQAEAEAAERPVNAGLGPGKTEQVGPSQAALPPRAPTRPAGNSQSEEAAPAASICHGAPAAAQNSGMPRSKSDTTDSRKSIGWHNAKDVLTAVRATSRFRTLRDLVGAGAYIQPGRLRIIRPLGEGAFAKVQLADLLPEAPVKAGSGSSGSQAGGSTRQVAVKTLRQELLQEEEQIRLFVSEVSLMRRLRYRYIVEFIGCSWQQKDSRLADPAKPGEEAEAPRELYYVQEYCSGGSLGDLVRRQMIQPFRQLYSQADALRWSLQIAQALQYLHQSRPAVMHRDLKLENVMLTSSDVGRANARLADFGLARLTPPSDKKKMERLTKLLSEPRSRWEPGLRASFNDLQALLQRALTGPTVQPGPTEQGGGNSGSSSEPSMAPSALASMSSAWADVSSRVLTGKTGSFGYMAPEVSRSLAYNTQADIFSLAMVMYCLFCRTIPTLQILLNGDESHLELYAAQVAEGYRPPLLNTLPQSVKDAIEACWKGDPDLRPGSSEVVDLLRAIEASGDAAGTPKAGGDSFGEHSCTCCSVM